MKKTLLTSSVAIFTSLMLVGCGDSEDKKTTKSEPKAEEVVIEAEPEVEEPKAAVCEEVTEKTTACVFKDGIAAYHTRDGLFLTSEVQGSAKVSIFPGIREADSLTDGVENTKAILAHSEVFPAAHICNDLGEGWYLPAAKEVEAAFVRVPRGTDLLNHKFLTSTFIRDGFGTESVAMLDSNSQYFYPALGNAGLMKNTNDYSVICARKVVSD